LNNRILNYTSELSKATDFIQNDLAEYFTNVDYKEESREIKITKIKNEEDLNKIIYGAGFYIILTNHPFQENKCEFEFNNQKAIYRGHSYFSKKRLLSHLANSNYQNNKGSTNYTVCLKIENGKNGININQNPYKKWNWTIIVHKMKGSSKLMREQAEKAFDELYNKPCKSRD